MSARRAFVGAGLGFAAGYIAVRTYQAVLELRQPTYAAEKDAIAYSRLRRGLEIVGTIRSTAGFAAFAYASLAARADRATSKLPSWARPAAFIGSFSLASSLLELPVSFVEEYSLERHFGLSDQSESSWLSDYAKGAAISTGLTALLATLFGFAVRRAPSTWPILAAIGVFPLFVIGNLIVPLYVMPLFNTFEPVTGSLEERIRALATRFGVGNAAILRMDMSKQTRKANAFVTGIGQTHRIVLGDTLIAKLSRTRNGVRGGARARPLRQQRHLAAHWAGRSTGNRALPDGERDDFARGSREAARPAVADRSPLRADAGHDAGASSAPLCLLPLARMGGRPLCAGRDA
jgi:STE24 endopeptidase